MLCCKQLLPNLLKDKLEQARNQGDQSSGRPRIRRQMVRFRRWKKVFEHAIKLKSFCLTQSFLPNEVVDFGVLSRRISNKLYSIGAGLASGFEQQRHFTLWISDLFFFVFVFNVLSILVFYPEEFGLKMPPRKQKAAKEKQITLGPQLAEGENNCLTLNCYNQNCCF